MRNQNSPFCFLYSFSAILVTCFSPFFHENIYVKSDSIWEEETTSALNINIPEELYKPDGYNHKEALFGIPVYGGTIAEKLQYAGESNLMCSAPTAEQVSQWTSPFILMIDRGTCTFVTKVRHAQHAGASGVIIADDKYLCDDEHQDQTCQKVEPIMADDGSGSDITIPSFLMYKQDAEKVKDVIKQDKAVMVDMTWSLPAPDDRVEWTLWTNSNDNMSNDLKTSFGEIIELIGTNQFFTPYYQVYDGDLYNCPNIDCGNLCTNDGKYCMPDPDGNTNHGLSGRDIITENVRQKCIWNIYGGEITDDTYHPSYYNTNKDVEGVGIEWWNYVKYFTENCAENRFTDANCINEALNAAKVDTQKLNQCLEANPLNGESNSILQAELDSKTKNSIVIVPSVYINQVPQRGAISRTNVLNTICAGYLEGTEPQVCTCSNLQKDEQEKCIQEGGVYNTDKEEEVVIQGVSVGGVIGIIFVMVIVMGGAGYIYYQRTQAAMRDQVRSILAEYMPLEDMDGPLTGNSKNSYSNVGSQQISTSINTVRKGTALHDDDEDYL